MGTLDKVDWEAVFMRAAKKFAARMKFGERANREQHSADWTCWIGPEGSNWRICFRSVLLDLVPTREAARVRIRQYKANPSLADVAEVQLS